MRAAKLRSLDHLVGTAEQLRWHVKTECLGCLEIDHRLVLGRRLNRQLGGLLPLKNAVDVLGGRPVLLNVSPTRSAGAAASMD
jgi:hypothetical protein